MSKYIKLFKQTIKIGGSFLPADFPYFDNAAISNLIGCDFTERVKTVYELITNRKFNSEFLSSVKVAQYPASVVSVDDGVNLLELIDGQSADYTDYIFDKTDLLGKIASIIAVLFSAYCDLVESGQLELNQKFNIALTQNESAFILASIIAKKIGLPIGLITVATLKPVNLKVNDCYFEDFSESEIDDVISEFFEEYDYPLDPISASAFIPLVSFVNDYDDDGVFLMPMLISPYKFSRKVLKAITGKNQLDVSKAERMLYNETAMEIPSVFTSDNTKKFFAKPNIIEFNEVLQVLNQFI